MTNRRLVLLHRYNGWNLLFLLVTGVLLFTPGLRGAIAPVRTLLKNLHIAAGLLCILLLAAYVPLAPGHWKRLRNRIGQHANVIFLILLLGGWGVTGTALWYNRYLPAGIAEAALLWHDRLTWFAIPWVAVHSLTRYFRIKLLEVTAATEERRIFLAGAATLVAAMAWGRFGQKLGLPGFESAAASPSGPLTHQPLPEGAEPAPVPVSTPLGGGGAKGRFRVYSVVDPLPVLTPETWNLTVAGLVERPLKLAWQEFLALPQTVQVSNFHCVTGWSVYNVTWEGVRLADLLQQAAPTSDARYVKFLSGDGVYSDAMPMDVALMEDVMLPYRMDGGLLPTPLGGPVRLIIPQMYAYKSVKWVTGIELTDAPHKGYWEVRGYPTDAWLRKR